jgi:hypothetical protein
MERVPGGTVVPRSEVLSNRAFSGKRFWILAVTVSSAQILSREWSGV